MSIRIPANVALLAGVKKTFSELPEYIKKKHLIVFARYRNVGERYWRYIAKIKNPYGEEGWQGINIRNINANDKYTPSSKYKDLTHEEDSSFPNGKVLKSPNAALKRAMNNLAKPEVEYYID